MAGRLLMSRARKLFDYSNLGGSTSASSRPNEAQVSANMSSSSVHMDETRGIVSAENSSDTGTFFKFFRPSRRQKCVISFTAVFGLLAIFIILAMVRQNHSPTLALSAESSPQSSVLSVSSTEKRRIRVGDISYGRFYPTKFNATWVSDHEVLFEDSFNALRLMDVARQSSKVILSIGKMKHLNPESYKLSADKKYLLIQRTDHKVFRRSSYGEYAILDLRQQLTLLPLKPSDVDANSEDRLIRYVSWSPKGNALAYVTYNNNLYYRGSVLSQDEQLSKDGEASKVYNGVPDWVFEEEVFEENKALWWSPDASHLVWGSFDDSEVDSYFMAEYGSPDKIQQYPSMAEVRYPKVGRQNPKSKLWLTALADDGSVGSKEILPPSSLSNAGEVHFTWVAWADQGNKFAVTWMNRVQNETVVTLCSVTDLDCSANRDIFSRREPHGWIPYKYRITFNPVPINKTFNDFVTIYPAPFLKHHYRQLVYISANDGKWKYLTSVDGAEVVEVLKWTTDGSIYYISTSPYQPGTRHLFRIKMARNGVGGHPECVSCMVEKPNIGRRNCTYFESKMSTEGSFMALMCLGPDVPYTSIVHAPSSRALFVFENNNHIAESLKLFDMPEFKFLEIPVSETDQKARVKLMLPPDFDPANVYPLVVYAYGGPGFQSVSDSFSVSDLGVYMAGSTNVIYAIVDPRGSGYQGEDWRFSTYRRFGTAEVQSLTDVAKYLQTNVTYIDAKRTAVWGWSYGGYLSLMALARDTEGVFACGASVAPVVDWTLYDTYYTERYMGLSSKTDNFQGYNASSVFHYLDNLRFKEYFVLQGTFDDNVHYQQSMLLSSALEKRDILFRQQAYPDQDHSIIRYRLHLDHSLAEFFIRDCFDRI